MKFNELLRITAGEPVFTTGFLSSGLQSLEGLQVQLSRWVSEGKLIKLRRGLYSVSPKYSGISVHPFIAANAMVSASYVSCQSALAFHGVIPEHVPSVTSITSGNGDTLTNSLGSFIYRHVKPDHLWGFRSEHLGEGRTARVATAEKALLDLVYLEPGGDTIPFLRQLRLNGEGISPDLLKEAAARWGRKKLTRATENALSVISEEGK